MDRFAAEASGNRNLAAGMATTSQLPRPPNQFVRPEFGSVMAQDLQKQLLEAYHGQQQFSGDASHAWKINQTIQQTFLGDRSQLENVASPNPDWSEALDALEAFDSNFFSTAVKLSSNDEDLHWNRPPGSPRREQQRSGSGDSEDEEAIRNLESMGNSIFRNMTDFGDDDADLMMTNYSNSRNVVRPHNASYVETSSQRLAIKAAALFSKETKSVTPEDQSAKAPEDITGVTDVRTLEAMLLKTLRIGDSASKKDTPQPNAQTSSYQNDQQSRIIGIQPQLQRLPLQQPSNSTSFESQQLYSPRLIDPSAYAQRMPHDQFRNDGLRQPAFTPTSPAANPTQNNAAYYYTGTRPLGNNASPSVMPAAGAMYNNGIPRHIVTTAGMHSGQIPSRPINAVLPVNNMQRMLLSRSPSGGNVAGGLRPAVEGGVFPPPRMVQQQHQHQQRMNFAQYSSGQQHPHMQQMRDAQMTADAARRAYFFNQQHQQQQQQSPFLQPSPAAAYANQQHARQFAPPPPMPLSGGAQMPPVTRGEARTFTNSNLKNNNGIEFGQSPPSMAEIQQQQYQQHQQQQAHAQAAANYHQQLQQFYQQHGLPKANSYAGGGFCRFYGWMTEHERNLVLTQKECQTKTNNPYIDDYYYFHWRMVYDRSGVLKPMLRQRNWVEDISNMVLPPKCSTMNAPSDWYTVQFRGSLGKISTLSVFAPRQMIDIEADDILFQCEVSEKKALSALHAKKLDLATSADSMLTSEAGKLSDADDEQLLWRARRRLMMKVENMYVSVLNLEDSCRRLRILAGRASAAVATAAGSTVDKTALLASATTSASTAAAEDEVDGAPSVAPTVQAGSTGDVAVAVTPPVVPPGTTDNAALIAAINEESTQFLRTLTSCFSVNNPDNTPLPFGSDSSSSCETRMLFCILTLNKGRQWLVRLLFQLPQPYMDELTLFLLESLVCRRSEFRRVQRLSPTSAARSEESEAAGEREKSDLSDHESKLAANEKFDPLVPSPLFQVRVGIVDAIVLVEKLANSIARLTFSSSAVSTLAADAMTADVSSRHLEVNDAKVSASKAKPSIATLLQSDIGATNNNDAENYAVTKPSSASTLPPIDLQEFIMDNLTQVEVVGSDSQASSEKSLIKALADKNLPPTLHQLGDVSLGFILLAIILYHDKVVPAAALPTANDNFDDDDEKEDIRQVARNWSPLVSCDALVLLVALFSRDHSAAIKRAAAKAHVDAARHVQKVFRLLNESELVGNEKHRAHVEELLRDYMQTTAAADAAAAAAQQLQQQEKMMVAGGGSVSGGSAQQSSKNHVARGSVPSAVAAGLTKTAIQELSSPTVISAYLSSAPPQTAAAKPALVSAAKPPPMPPKVAIMTKQMQQQQQLPVKAASNAPRSTANESAVTSLQQPQATDFLAEVIKRFL